MSLEYMIVQESVNASAAADLAQHVNELLADGWRLHGQPFHGHGASVNWLYQAMIRDRPE